LNYQAEYFVINRISPLPTTVSTKSEKKFLPYLLVAYTCYTQIFVSSSLAMDGIYISGGLKVPLQNYFKEVFS